METASTRPSSPPRWVAVAEQQGMALLVTMVAISVASLVGIFAMNNATMETKISGNFRNAARTLNWAETGRAVGRKLLFEATSTLSYGGADCDGSPAFFEYPAGAPKVQVCIRELHKENTSGTLGGSATSGSSVLYGTTYYYYVLSRTNMTTTSGEPIGMRAIESLERVTRLNF